MKLHNTVYYDYDYFCHLAVTVSFSQPTYAFSENDGETFDSIMVTLSTPIARSLFIDISAGTFKRTFIHFNNYNY